MSLEIAQKVIVPQKNNYVPQFLKQRDINSYNDPPYYKKYSNIYFSVTATTSWRNIDIGLFYQS
jgi:hypothetical protein